MKIIIFIGIILCGIIALGLYACIVVGAMSETEMDKHYDKEMK